jgi:nitrogen fixation protein FixH
MNLNQSWHVIIIVIYFFFVIVDRCTIMIITRNPGAITT